MSFAPTDISGCVFWVAADKITGLNDGDAVTTWSDLSGKGKDVTQAVAGLKPLYKKNIIFGQPVVRFDGVDDQLLAATTFLPAGSKDVTIVAMLKPRVVASWDIVGEGTPGNNTEHGAQINRFYGNCNDGGGSTGGVDYRTVITTDPTIIFYTHDSASGLEEAYVFNAANNHFTANNGKTGVISGSTSQLGYVGKGNERGSTIDGDIAEAFIYNRYLTNERTDIESYLRGKYGMFIVAPKSLAEGISFIGTHMYRKRKIF